MCLWATNSIQVTSIVFGWRCKYPRWRLAALSKHRPSYMHSCVAAYQQRAFVFLVVELNSRCYRSSLSYMPWIIWLDCLEGIRSHPSLLFSYAQYIWNNDATPSAFRAGRGRKRSRRTRFSLNAAIAHVPVLSLKVCELNNRSDLVRRGGVGRL